MEGIVERLCKNCIFFISYNPEGGNCYRYPPQLVSESYESGQSQTCQYYPWMQPDEWCGEFKDKWQVRKERVDP